MLACVVPEDVFIVPTVTSPDQCCHVSLCSPRVSANTAPRGHDYAVSPPLCLNPSLCSSPPVCPSFPGTGDLMKISVTMSDLSAIVFSRVIGCSNLCFGLCSLTIQHHLS